MQIGSVLRAITDNSLPLKQTTRLLQAGSDIPTLARYCHRLFVTLPSSRNQAKLLLFTRKNYAN
jgi:hypothetical protein